MEIEQISRVPDRISSLVSSKKEFIGKQVVNAILTLVILAVFGCLDFATLSVHLEYITHLSYWSKVITKTIAYLCIYNIGINILWDTEIRKSVELKEATESYDKLIKYKQLDFDDYITKTLNPQEKKKAYLSQINKKINSLNKFSRRKDRLLYSNDNPELQEKKLKNRYCIKRQELEDLKKEDYIEKNLDNIVVKYYEIDPTIFELSIDGSVVLKGYKTKGNATLGRVKASSGIVLTTIAISMFLASFSLGINKQEFANKTEAFLHYLLQCAEDIALMLWKLLSGMRKSKKIIEDEITMPYVNRVKILKIYLEWRLTTNQPNTKIYEELKKEEEAIEVELTADELIKLQQEKNNVVSLVQETPPIEQKPIETPILTNDNEKVEQ